MEPNGRSDFPGGFCVPQRSMFDPFGGKKKIKLFERKFLQKCGYDHIHTELAMVNFYGKEK